MQTIGQERSFGNVVKWESNELRMQEREEKEKVMPYKSKAQAAYFNINKKKLEKQGVNVDEWNRKSKGKKLPKKKK